MSERQSNRFLRLVVDEKTAASKSRATDWLLEAAPDPCPDDCDLIADIEGFPGGLKRKHLRELIENLVADSSLEKIRIGARMYLTRRKRPEIYRDDDRERFRLEIALDLEREKHLLYKTVIVFESIAIALILRQWALDPDFVLQLLR